jgi:hypothetical protein
MALPKGRLQMEWVALGAGFVPAPFREPPKQLSLNRPWKNRLDSLRNGGAQHEACFSEHWITA